MKAIAMETYRQAKLPAVVKMGHTATLDDTFAIREIPVPINQFHTILYLFKRILLLGEHSRHLFRDL